VTAVLFVAQEVTTVEQSAIERDIEDKAKKWIDEYGEDFLVELIDIYLKDTPNRLRQLRQAFDGDDSATFVREAHTLKSSSANVGAAGLSALAKEMEFAGRNGKMTKMVTEMNRFEEEFAQVKAALEAVRGSAEKFVNQER
jgi:HPt (histidine-containing phosphotransfer) domain-containing protein